MGLRGTQQRTDPRVEPTTSPPPRSPNNAPTERPLAKAKDPEEHLTGAALIAQLRHDLAAITAQLAREQQERAEDADKLAEMLSHVSNSESRVRAAEDRAQSELASVTHEASVLRERVARQEDELIATSLEIEQGRRALAAAQEEAAAAKAALEQAKSELAKAQATLRQAQMRAYSASRQHESSKKDQDEKLAAADRRAKSMRKYIEASTEMLRLTATALEGIERGEAEMDRLRETQRAERRAVLERALAVRESLKKASAGEGEVTVEVIEELWTDEALEGD